MHTACNTQRLQVAVATASFDFREVDVEVDAAPVTFRQLLEAAGYTPADDHLLFRVGESGALESLCLDEAAALREGATDRLVAFKSDRSFPVEINGRRLEWGESKLTGLCAKQLAGEPSPSIGIWLIWTDGTYRFIQDTDIIDLNRSGMERIRTGPAHVLQVEGADFQWPEPSIAAEQIAKLGGWEFAEGVDEVDLVTQQKRRLTPGEVVDLEKCKVYGKRIGWRRG